MNSDLVDIVLDVTRAIINCRQRLTSHAYGYHADQDKSDDETLVMKKQLTTLLEVREKLEGLL